MSWRTGPAAALSALLLLPLACGDDNADPAAPAGAGSGGSTSELRVGDACLTENVPEEGFDGQEAYVEGGHDECGGGPCLVYRLDGDPRDGCIPSASKRCPTPAEIEMAVHCTCRCEAPEGQSECTCPDGFTCVPVLDVGGPDVRGSYCVRNRTVAR